MKWISTTKKLPEKNGFYLVQFKVGPETIKGDSVHALWFIDGNWRHDEHYRPGEEVWETFSRGEVIFWQHLPKEHVKQPTIPVSKAVMIGAIRSENGTTQKLLTLVENGKIKWGTTKPWKVNLLTLWYRIIGVKIHSNS